MSPRWNWVQACFWNCMPNSIVKRLHAQFNSELLCSYEIYFETAFDTIPETCETALKMNTKWMKVIFKTEWETKCEYETKTDCETKCVTNFYPIV